MKPVLPAYLNSGSTWIAIAGSFSERRMVASPVRWINGIVDILRSIADDDRRCCLSKEDFGLTTAVRRHYKHAHPLWGTESRLLIEDAFRIEPFHLVIYTFFFRQR